MGFKNPLQNELRGLLGRNAAGGGSPTANLLCGSEARIRAHVPGAAYRAPPCSFSADSFVARKLAETDIGDGMSVAQYDFSRRCDDRTDSRVAR
jgi:hypothetical protein